MAHNSSSHIKRNMAIVFLLLLAGGAVVAFQTDFVRRAIAKPAPTYSNELLSMIVVDGAVKVQDLNLSKREIRKINIAAMRLRHVFPKVDVSVNMDDQFAAIDVKKDTQLEVGMVFKADEDCEVKFWPRKMKRSRFASQVVRCMELAVKEYDHYKGLPEIEGVFKRLYI